MKQAVLLLSFVLTPTLLWASGSTTTSQHLPVDFYEVAEMPLTITSAELRRSGDADALTFSVTNRSSERLMGLRLILIVVDPTGKLRSRTGWMERIDLEINATDDYSSKLSAKMKIRPGDRVVLTMEQVIGRESIWKVINAKEAFTAYASNTRHVMPDVRQVSNNVDVSPGMMIP